MSKKVLLCDDEIHILRAPEFKLSRAGFEVRCAINGKEAWDLIEQDLPDILVTDVQMPVMDGFELSQRIRENEATRELPVVMLTAKGFEGPHLERARQCGVRAVLRKPFSPRELVRSIEEILTAASASPVGPNT